MSIAWPSTLPDLQLLGLSDQEADATFRFPTDGGVPRVRPRYSAVPRNLEVPLVFTGAQRKAWRTFWLSIARGATSFTWEDPVDDAAVTMRVRKAPAFMLDTGGTSDERLWRTVLSLEIIP